MSSMEKDRVNTDAHEWIARASKSPDYPCDDFEMLEVHLRRHFLRALPSPVLIDRIIRRQPAITRKHHERGWRHRLQQQSHSALVTMACYSRRQSGWWTEKLVIDKMRSRIIGRALLVVTGVIVVYLLMKVFIARSF